MAKVRVRFLKLVPTRKSGSSGTPTNFTDCLDDSEIVDFDVDIQSSKIYYHIETHLSEEMRSIAKRKGVSPSILLNSWVRERLREEKRVIG